MSQCITFDSAVYTAMQQLKQQQTDSIPPLNQLATIYTPSQSLADRLEAIIAKAEKAFNRKSWGKNIARIAAAVIIAVTLLSANPTVATAMKKIFSQTVIQWFDKYISVETKADTYPQSIKDFDVGYMTDGFELKEQYYIEPEVIKVFYGDKLFIKINIRPDDGGNTIFFDNEYSNFTEIVLNDSVGMMGSHSSGYNRFIVSVNGIQYDIAGFIENDEILKIYKNIRILL